MSPVVLFILGVVFVVIGIAVSIALHEVGHLVPAKLFKVRVTKYMIGFGPTLWSKRRGETEYGLKAIPLGGFVSMIGMYPPNKTDGSVRPSSTGMFQSLAADARSLAHEEIGPGDGNRVFYRLPVWKKIIIMLGGPAMNLLIGVVLTAVLLMGFGVSTSTTTIADVSKCQVKAGETVDPNSADCKPTPAAAAGLKPNDRITSFDGKAVTSWEELTGWIRASAGRQVSITVERDGSPVTTTVTPVLSARPVVGADGRQAKDADGKLQYQDVGFLGIGAQTALVPQPASAVLPMAGENIQQIAGVVLNLPARVAGRGAGRLQRGAPRPQRPHQRRRAWAGWRAKSPPWNRFRCRAGWPPWWGCSPGSTSRWPCSTSSRCCRSTAATLPAPCTRVPAAGWPSCSAGPDPGAFDIAKLLPVTYVVAALLMGMSALLIYADIVKPVNLFG